MPLLNVTSVQHLINFLGSSTEDQRTTYLDKVSNEDLTYAFQRGFIEDGNWDAIPDSRILNYIRSRPNQSSTLCYALRGYSQNRRNEILSKISNHELQNMVHSERDINVIAEFMSNERLKQFIQTYSIETFISTIVINRNAALKSVSSKTGFFDFKLRNLLLAAQVSNNSETSVVSVNSLNDRIIDILLVSQIVILLNRASFDIESLHRIFTRLDPEEKELVKSSMCFANLRIMLHFSMLDNRQEANTSSLLAEIRNRILNHRITAYDYNELLRSDTYPILNEEIKYELRQYAETNIELSSLVR